MMESSAVSRYRTIRPAELESADEPARDFGLDVLHGLSGARKSLPSKYFYDAEGSRLFQRITELEEYYPTRCEREVLVTHQARISELVDGDPLNLIELGVGDGHKTRILLDRLASDGRGFTYVPIDISESAVGEATESALREFPGLQIQGLVSEYFDGIRWISSLDDRRSLVLFLGSNIGNFDRRQATTFLRTLWSSLSGGDLVLIGFDLKKNIQTMIRAYNDAAGVTRDFNLNLLRRINRELGGSFDLSKFSFYSTYDVFSGAMESYLVSLEKQTVRVAAVGQEFHFEPFEPIQTEYSYKYLEPEIDALAADTGFEPVAKFHDSKRWFADVLWRVVKTTS